MKAFSSIRTNKVHDSAVLEHPVNITSNVTINRNVRIGRFTYISEGSRINSGTDIGRFCSIATNCEIGAPAHPSNWLSTHPFQYTPSQFKGMPEYTNIKHRKHNSGRPAYIGHDVWIGAKAIICRGVKIGDGAIIGAGSFVNKDIPAYAVAVGSPAKVIKYRFQQEVIHELIKLKWWNLSIDKLSNAPFDDIENCIEYLKSLSLSGCFS